MPVQGRHPQYARSNVFHGPKHQVLGQSATRQAPPAWKISPNGTAASGQLLPASAKGKMVQESGSRIFLSKLPIDVGEKEVEELFRKTVGPLKESFLVYNSQGNSKGMAVVWFQRPGDAAVARAKYDGKIVDGRRPIKIEILVDGVPAPPPVKFPTPPSLLDRLAPSLPATTRNVNDISSPRPQQRAYRPLNVTPASADEIPVPPRRVRQKKGPKRVNKRASVNVADLDREMDDYRAAAPEYQLLTV
ncbi:hypothetical protein CPB84DRAFT_1707077 [Gymnopilus junonius]|uniref:RRM domain-containing protein n=1 Tax=Gymnopilus junonius TaxID=109634 RepID=A0A9P5NSE3_GYMJU|nr:hypothetical protein CPB84DRAFT_1707077 [Gymnopilus junonius]